METLHKAAIINGKAIALEERKRVNEDVVALRERLGKSPGLAVILVGDNPASRLYVRNKERACTEAGIKSFEHALPNNAAQEVLAGLIRRLNGDDDVHGILLQLPLPKHIDSDAMLGLIAPEKDVDGFHPCNMGKLLSGGKGIRPCTPLGIIRLIESTGIDVAGKEAVVIGRSNIVGKPAAIMLLQRNATVTVCHSRTKGLADKVKGADIVVAAIGIPGFVKGEWIKEGAVVIDVGINKLPDGRITGDVEFEAASLRASHITPVPGGVGPMTIAMLLRNTVEAAMNSLGPKG